MKISAMNQDQLASFLLNAQAARALLLRADASTKYEDGIIRDIEREIESRAASSN